MEGEAAPGPGSSMPATQTSSRNAAQYKQGGRVKKSGPAKLHKGEVVIRKGKRNGRPGRSSGR
jgi:hypothetical protein